MRTLVFIFIFLSMSKALLAKSPPVVLEDGKEFYEVGLNLDILEDPTGKLTIDDVNRPERTFFDTHSATDAKWLRNEADGRSRFDLNAHFTDLVSRTCLCAFLSTLLWFAPIRIDNGDSKLSVVHYFLLISSISVEID